MDTPPLIEIGSNLIWLFSLFASFLLAFHAWLVYWKPLSDIWWKRVDYIWLAVAVVGLVGQSAQVRQHWFRSTYEISNFRVADTLETLKRQADFSIGPVVCRMFNRMDYSPKNLDELQSEYNYACGEFKRLTQEVRSSNEGRDVGFLELLDTSQVRQKLSDPILIDVLAKLEKDHRTFVDALSERSAAKSKTQTTSFEYALIVLSPFLLLIAIALRITKVTGEIRLKR